MKEYLESKVSGRSLVMVLAPSSGLLVERSQVALVELLLSLLLLAAVFEMMMRAMLMTLLLPLLLASMSALMVGAFLAMLLAHQEKGRAQPRR